MGILATTYDALPWHYQKMYREMLKEEIETEREEQERQESGRGSSGSSSAGPGVQNTKAMAHGDLANTPFQVRTVGG